MSPPAFTGAVRFGIMTVPLLSALAAQTEHLRRGLLVTSNRIRPPALLAKIAATVDVVSVDVSPTGLWPIPSRHPVDRDALADPAIVRRMPPPASPAAPDASALLKRAPQRLSADGVVLRATQERDAVPLAAAFLDDPELGRLLGNDHDPSEGELREQMARRRAPGTSVVEWAITLPDTDTCVGSMLLHSLHARHRRAELGFFLVPAARGKGVGRRAVALTVRCLFAELDLHRVEMTTTPDNAALRALALALGFTEEGTMRSRNLERGSHVDVVFFGLLRSDRLTG